MIIGRKYKEVIEPALPPTDRTTTTHRAIHEVRGRGGGAQNAQRTTIYEAGLGFTITTFKKTGARPQTPGKHKHPPVWSSKAHIKGDFKKHSLQDSYVVVVFFWAPKVRGSPTNALSTTALGSPIIKGCCHQNHNKMVASKRSGSVDPKLEGLLLERRAQNGPPIFGNSCI